MLHPERLKIVEALREPGSAASLARQLEQPRQQVNYHLRELERQGLVELVEERRKGNCVERIVRATAHSYIISPSVLGKLGASPADAVDRFSWATLVASVARAIRDLAVLRRRADQAKKKLVTLSLETEVRFSNPAERNAFAEELTNAIAALAAKYNAPEGRLFRFFLGSYPVITKSEEESA